MNNSKFKVKKLVFITVCFSFVFAILSCSEIAQKIDGGGQDTKREQEFIITGTLSVDVNGAVPSEVVRSVYGGASSLGLESSARTATPSIPSSITYKVTATSGSNSVEGDVDQTRGTFTIKLSSGTWAIKAEGFSDSSMSEDKKILEGSTSVNLLPNNVDDKISITLSPISDGNVNGNVSLPISVASDSGIQSAIVKVFEDFAGTKQITVTPALEYDFSTEKRATISADNLASGTRYFVITFYSVALSEAKAKPNQKVAYKVHEAVNIFQNLTTDTWQGNMPYLTGGQFRITKNLVDTFSRKEFYVQGKSETTYTPPTAASDDNSGTPFDPFETLQQAVNTINDINDGTSAYTIKVDGTVTQPENASAESFVNISSDKNLNLTIEGVTGGTNQSVATIDANRTTNNQGSVFSIGGNENINVTLKNLTVTGGNKRGEGGGIYVHKGNLTLSNVEVTNNSASLNGGGIFFDGEKLTLEGSKISNNTVGREVSGGGIYVQNGNLDITDSEISKNEADYGGGIYFHSANFNTTVKITGNTNISENKLKYKTDGTAIYVCYGSTAELSGNVSITPVAGDKNPVIYLMQGETHGRNEIPDAVLKLGGAVQIGNGSGTGIKIEGKKQPDTANIKITSSIDQTTPLIYISYDGIPNNNSIIGGENYTLTQKDCDKFRVNDSLTVHLIYDNTGISNVIWG